MSPIMANPLRSVWQALFDVDANIAWLMGMAKACHARVPVIGPRLARIIDRWLLWTYALDVYSHTVHVAHLSMAHPSGILLGGNGIRSSGRVAIMSGVKFVGRSPSEPEYLARHAGQRVFQLGDNVGSGANSVVVGPVDICDNVVVAAMSLVNRSISEPGIYAALPAKTVRDDVPGDEWVAHMPSPGQRK